MTPDPLDPTCVLCGMRSQSDCVCTVRLSEHDRDPRIELERHLRAATRRTLRTDLPEAERLASRIAEAR